MWPLRLAVLVHQWYARYKNQWDNMNPSMQLGRNTMRKWLPGWYSGKESICQCRRLRRPEFDSWVGKIPWRRKWQPTPVFLPWKSHGQRSLVGYSPWGHKELDTTEHIWNKRKLWGDTPEAGNLKPAIPSQTELPIRELTAPRDEYTDMPIQHLACLQPRRSLC